MKRRPRGFTPPKNLPPEEQERLRALAEDLRAHQQGLAGEHAEAIAALVAAVDPARETITVTLPSGQEVRVFRQFSGKAEIALSELERRRVGKRADVKELAALLAEAMALQCADPPWNDPGTWTLLHRHVGMKGLNDVATILFQPAVDTMEAAASFRSE